MKIKVENMESNKGNKAVNQFVIQVENATYFQSYSSIIAKKENGVTSLDEYYWDYSRTTTKYRNLFLNMNSSEVVRAIDSGEIKLANLN